MLQRERTDLDGEDAVESNGALEIKNIHVAGDDLHRDECTFKWIQAGRYFNVGYIFCSCDALDVDFLCCRV